MADDRNEAFARFVESLLDGTRPAPDEIAADEGPMARLAAELAAAGDPEHGNPDPAFVEQLRRRMRDADEGIAAVRGKTPPTSMHRIRVTRRDL